MLHTLEDSTSLVESQPPKKCVPTDLRHMFVILQAFHIDLNHLPDPILFMHCDLKKALFNQ